MAGGEVPPLMVFIERAGNHALRALIKHYKHYNTMQTLEHNLSQAERLALCDGRTVTLDPATLGIPPVIHPTTGQPVFVPTWERNGTPSRAYVGIHPMVPRSSDDEESTEDDDDSNVLTFEEARTYAPTFEERESDKPPSARGFAQAWKEAFDIGFACE